MPTNQSIFDSHNADVNRQRKLKTQKRRFNQLATEQDNLKSQIDDLKAKIQQTKEKLNNLELQVIEIVSNNINKNGKIVQSMKARNGNPNATD